MSNFYLPENNFEVTADGTTTVYSPAFDDLVLLQVRYDNPIGNSGPHISVTVKNDETVVVALPDMAPGSVVVGLDSVGGITEVKALPVAAGKKLTVFVSGVPAGSRVLLSAKSTQYREESK